LKQVDEVGEQLLELAKAADYLQMKVIHEEVEGRLILKLTIATCARLLSGAVEGGVPALLKACRSMALKGFVEFVGTRDFKRIPSDVLMSLLGDDTLQSKDEVPFLALFLDVPLWSI
jgi:BTB And C-terminal Kelch